jgi:hypothetical protein
MKRILFLILIIISCFLNAKATHNKGGLITYKHISGHTYEISVFTYTEASSQADRPNLEIFWGDGSYDSIARINQVMVNNNLMKNTYKGIHTFPGANPSPYIISVEDPNRDAGILNIPNSVNVVFYLESELSINPFIGINNSVNISNEPIYVAVIGESFTQNISAFDTDGDNISFELVTTKRENGQDIIGYSSPDSLSIDIVNGELVWNFPQFIGEYVFTIKISECRNGSKVGSILVDFQISVIPGPNNAQFQEMSTWQIDTNNNYSVIITPNDSVQLNLAYYGSSSTIDLVAYGETFIGGNNGVFQIDSVATGYIRKTFKWNPDITNLRCSPYIVTFRGSSSIIDRDLTLMVYVRDQSLNNCELACNSLINSVDKQIGNKNVFVYPNPFKTKTRITFSNPNNLNMGTLNVFDIRGKKVISIPVFKNNEVVINRANLPSGVYIYHFENNLGSIDNGKLIIID